MKFAHLADCHIGSWRDPKLNNLSLEAFKRAIDIAISNKVDFILIAGDLFNTSLPPIDKLKEVTKKLKELKDKSIPVYLVAGSHDFSPSGKTMLDVLENAGLCINVAKGSEIDGKIRLDFTVDKRTGAKITGLLGKKGSLEKSYYEELSRSELEKEEGFKIFVFHTLLTELKPKELEKSESQPLSLLPKNFDYYAGGHPHFVFNKKEEGYGVIAYPGPLFPNSFAEIEKLNNGGFYLYEDGKLSWEPIQLYNTHHINIDCSHKGVEQIEQELADITKNMEFFNTIITVRLSGVMGSGKPSQINWRDIMSRFYDKGAYFVMKNTGALLSKEFEEIKIDASNVEDIEEGIIKEHLGQTAVFGEKESEIIKGLMNLLSLPRDEGEKVSDFEKKLKDGFSRIIDLR